MKINNFDTGLKNNNSQKTSFGGGIWVEKGAHEAMQKLSQDVHFGERFRSAFGDIVELSKDHNIHIDILNKGSKISRILPDGKHELLAFDPTDFSWALSKAADKLLKLKGIIKEK